MEMNANLKEIFDWIYRRGYNNGLMTNKINEMEDYVSNMPESEIKNKISADLEFLFSISDEDD